MQAVIVTMGTGNRATAPYSSRSPTGRIACAESPGVLRAQGHVRWMRGTGHVAGGWTERMRRGRTAASPLCHDLNSVRPYACSALAGLERLQADLCRSLGAVSTRPCTLPDGVLRWPGGQDAGVWQSREDGGAPRQLTSYRHTRGLEIEGMFQRSAALPDVERQRGT